ncbi:MAG: glycosyltransferase [Candidatus Pacebacteria bacterium]|nr:glycosyltransferase [Candidatus Paceibacterota bacterium]
MKKILQIAKLYYPKIGGVERIVQQISEELNKKENFGVEVLCCNQRRKRKIENVFGTKVFYASNLKTFWGMPTSFDFLKLFKRIRDNYDILNFHQPFPLADLALFLFPTKAKVVVHYHSDIVRQKILEIFIKPFVYNTLKKAKKIIVSNPNLVKGSKILKKFRDKCVVIPFGVEISKYQKFDPEKIREIQKKYNKFILFVGRLSYYKGVSYLIEAMKDIDANLVIIGEGEEKKKLKKLTKNLKIENKIFFLPFQPERKLINFYYACQTFVLPSIYRSEAFGIVLIEAMACKKPVISTELQTGTSWVNQNNFTGFVVPPKDVESLKMAIKKILEDNNLYSKFSQNVFLRVKEKFTLEKMINSLKEVYQNL